MQICQLERTQDSRLNIRQTIFFSHIADYIWKSSILIGKCDNFTMQINYWQDIPRGELHKSLEAKKTDNKVKNRYTTIYPCMYYTCYPEICIQFQIFIQYSIFKFLFGSFNRWSFESCFRDDYIRRRKLYQCKLHWSRYW